MFGNFLYFVVVLLIYSTYHPSEETNFTFLETTALFICFLAFFAWFTWRQFHRLQTRFSSERFYRYDDQFSSLLTRQSVIAIMLFAVNIYVLNLPSFFMHIAFFRLIPTALAALFLGLFVFYLTVVWSCAWGPYQILYNSGLSRRSYILSNISFSLPVLLPWLLLSGIADIINALPFELPKRLLSTTEGEILYFLIFLFGIAIIGPAMIQKFWRCKPLDPGVERTRIENLCRKADVEYANILYWPIFGGRMITAGVMGLVKKFRYVLVTGGLIRFLQPEEIDAVIAHEIGHIKKNHLLFYLFFFVGYLLIAYASFDLILFAIIYAKPVYRLVEITGLPQTTIMSAIFSLVIILIFLIYFRFIFGYFMRNFERQADIYVYELFDSAQPLISTFRKIIVASGQSPDKPNWHHFSIKERIDYLMKCETDKTWITRHHGKIKKSIAVYLAGIFCMGFVGYHLNYGETGRKISTHFFEKIVHREIARDRQNPNLYSLLGDLYYRRNNFEGTIDAYETSLSLEPNNPEVLNNLAWLYATCGIERFRNPDRALVLALRALKLDVSPHILDTLAESYYVNGLYDEAVAAEKRALNLAPRDRSYYEKQLKKFTDTTPKSNRQ
ncbi:M48 family metalloprotease [Thermodesulfobacteriota bacterium]